MSAIDRRKPSARKKTTHFLLKKAGYKNEISATDVLLPDETTSTTFLAIIPLKAHLSVVVTEGVGRNGILPLIGL